MTVSVDMCFFFFFFFFPFERGWLSFVAFRAIVGGVSMINLLGACGLRAWSGENTTF